jgi:hypothetical protein
MATTTQTGIEISKDGKIDYATCLVTYSEQIQEASPADGHPEFKYVQAEKVEILEFEESRESDLNIGDDCIKFLTPQVIKSLEEDILADIIG